MPHSSELRREDEMYALVVRQANERMARRRRRGRIVAGGIAAVLCLALGLLVAAHGGSSTDGRRVDQAGYESAGRRAPGPTGFVVPGDLKARGRAIYSVRSVEVVDAGPAVDAPQGAGGATDEPCACELATWTGPEGRIIRTTTEPGTSTASALAAYDSVHIHHVEQRINTARASLVSFPDERKAGGPSTVIVLVSDGHRLLRLVGVDADLSVMRTIASDWVGRQVPGLVSPIQPLTGWRVSSVGSARAGQSVPFVRITFGSTSGSVVVDLVPPGSRRFSVASAAGPLASGAVVYGEPEVGRAVLALPGVDAFVDPGQALSAHERQTVVKVFAGLLRPAGATGWRAFLGTVQHGPGLDGDSLFDVSWAAAHGRALAPTTAVARKRYTSYRGVDGLQLAIDLEGTTVVSGTPLPGSLLLHNPTASTIVLNECNERLVQWGLVPEAHQTATLPGSFVIDCFNTPQLAIPAGSTSRLELARGFPARFLPTGGVKGVGDGSPSAKRGPLPPGRYRAGALVPSRSDDLRVVDASPITVLPDPCPAPPASFAPKDPDQQLTLSKVANARANAAYEGLRFRTLHVGDGPGPIDCGRITGYLDIQGRIDAFVRS